MRLTTVFVLIGSLALFASPARAEIANGAGAIEPAVDGQGAGLGSGADEVAMETAAAGDTELAVLEPGRIGTDRRPDTGEPRIEPDDEVFLIEAGLTYVSDYRARGVSASAGKVALQGELAVEHRSGFYASVWASNMADNGGADIEVDLFAGYSQQLGPIRADLGVMGYVYPGAKALNYYELQGALGLSLGKGELSVNLAYGPRQPGLGGEDNFYVELTGEVPLGKTPLSLSGALALKTAISVTTRSTGGLARPTSSAAFSWA